MRLQMARFEVYVVYCLDFAFGLGPRGRTGVGPCCLQGTWYVYTE